MTAIKSINRQYQMYGANLLILDLRYLLVVIIAVTAISFFFYFFWVTIRIIMKRISGLLKIPKHQQPDSFNESPVIFDHLFICVFFFCCYSFLSMSRYLEFFELSFFFSFLVHHLKPKKITDTTNNT